ncbi:hypothetical protein Bcep1808_7076 (plasmid) [Burkholderia vietnamiensis G4]|uniref:Uncharacterized protein n=1 Tax=Burkholderia vietnamiensis (strain G4 / LMG 22486) TaxID=269482 RepID=A4JUK6_BURVG|nr:hypothetical protein Bcep1808_7076 [Burkholderia vietnamiensis G4]
MGRRSKAVRDWRAFGAVPASTPLTLPLSRVFDASTFPEPTGSAITRHARANLAIGPELFRALTTRSRTKALRADFLARPEHRSHRALSGHPLFNFLWREAC